MSSKRRSYDTDEITLRRVFAKHPTDNTNIAGLRVLTADGAGGTYWAQPSTLGQNPSFNQINTTAGNFTADLSYNIFTLSQGTNMGFTVGPGSNELYLFGKSFSVVNVQSNNTINAFANNSLNSNLNIVGTGGMNITSDPTTNTISFDIQGIQISSSQFSFQKAKVLSNTSTVSDGISSLQDYLILNSASPSSILTFVGLGEVSLQGDYLNNAIYFGLNISTGTTSSLIGLVDSISSTYTKLTDFSTACESISTIASSNFSTSVSTSYGINSNLSIVVFNLPFNLYTTTAQFNDFQNRAESGISSIADTYTPLDAFFSTTNSLADQFSTINNVSSVSTFVVFGGTVTNFTADTVIYNLGDLSSFSTSVGDQINLMSNVFDFAVSSVSTMAGVADSTNQYYLVSSIDNLVITLGDYGYVSSATLDYALASTIENLGSLGYLSSASLDFALASTIENLGSLGYLSSASLDFALASTIENLGSLGYLSSIPSDFLSFGVSTNFLIAYSNISLYDNSVSPAEEYNFTLSNSSIYANNKKLISFLPSFMSSLYYSGNNGEITGEVFNLTDINDPSVANSFLFSTLHIDLVNDQNISDYMSSQTRLFLDYTFNINFSHYLFDSALAPQNDFNGNIITFSTLVSYDTDPDYENVINDSFVPTGTFATGETTPGEFITGKIMSNSITRRNMFNLDSSRIVSDSLGAWKKVNILHVFNESIFTSNDNISGYWGGLSTASVNIRVNSTNNVFITLQN
jgi:hypothetical protein